MITTLSASSRVDDTLREGIEVVIPIVTIPHVSTPGRDHRFPARAFTIRRILIIRQYRFQYGSGFAILLATFRTEDECDIVNGT
jgi:hypothetical protein